ncbi:MAG: membrane protein insertase YidC [Flavobacterium sp.]|jgi:YidC/Oxa1 family membrane protein insertase|uniref:membrane protein insertase YidC n=2 Tax=Flavobacterium sp. TaxID=239 RepID=UPI0022C0DFE3|nr:membrane protein insertase YidC [Flavobacterium sp.]MCZ8168872.1 membrane protein insertase YidC [Flavobacterium sp.]MCZ8296813.1 membrane protein insertase YidC [Flavobacterium sp.]
MEEKKFDKNSVIGFALLFVLILWMMYNSSQEQQKAQTGKATTAQKSTPKKDTPAATPALPTDTTVTDSNAVKAAESKFGKFAYAATLPAAKGGTTVLENDLVKIVVANQGGAVQQVTLKKFEKFRKNSGQLVQLVDQKNAQFNLEIKTTDNRVLQTKDLFFEPQLTKVGADQVLSMKLKAGPNAFLEYKYVLKANDYMLDFDVRSQGLRNVLAPNDPVQLDWSLKTFRNEISIPYENRYTETIFEYEDGKDDYVGQGQGKEENPEAVTYVAYRQHFFASVLMTNKPFKTAKLTSDDLVKDAEKDTVFTKQLTTRVPLELAQGELDYKMNWYFGPADYQLLNNYDRNLDEVVPMGWGIFGWINKFIFVPLFGLLGGWMAFGWAIILFTIIIKLAMSPITFKSFLSQAKMKVLRPEITELNTKFKDPVKRQQEMMKLYSKAGVNPMAGCIPALIQLPFVYASFQFFPAAIELRQKSFLWAEDLSSFDAIVKLPFYIPLYGNHISLFPILAAIAIFFYMKMTSGDNAAMAQPAQEGMPDMAKLMKIMIYVSPIMMLIFFNSYGSGLSLYNFMSNVVTIGVMLVIKKYFIDSDKIHAQIQENKQKPAKESKFQRKMREMMEQAEAQKQLKGKK